MKNELIMIHCGQCGVQGGATFWEQLAYEHSINADGFHQSLDLNYETKFEPHSFFHITPKNRFVPRTIYVDSEPSVIDEVKNGVFRTLYNPLSYVHGKEEASNNYARGRFILGGALHDPICERIRKEVEATDLCQGFFVNHSTGGGTGAGLTVRIMEHIANDYSKAANVQIPIFPSEYLSTAIVDPYNALLHCGFNMTYSNLVIMLDNHAIMNLLSRHLQVEKPTFLFMNRLVSQISSCLLCGFHYNVDPTCGTLDEIATNLVPFPSMHFTFLRYAPIIGSRRSNYVTSCNPAQELTKSVLSPYYSTLTADKSYRGKIIACCLSFRGASAGCQRGLSQALYETKSNGKLNFVDWCPTGVKVSVHAVPPLRPVPESGIAEVPANVTMLANGAGAATGSFTNILTQFDKLYDRRSFVHWYVGEGMEEGEFVEAADIIKDTLDLYANAENPTADDDD